MWSLAHPPLRRTLTVLSMAGLLAAGGGITTAAQASPASSLTVKYKVNGTTHLKSVNATAKLGPGSLTTTANLSTGTLTANLALPATTVSFKLFGVVPVLATAKLTQDGETTGTVNLNTGAVKTTSKIILQLTSLEISGLALPVPKTCQSATPMVVDLTSQAGFSVVKGGPLAGTYTMPKVANCGELTAVLNAVFPGSGNTINLTLSDATAVNS